MLINIDKNISFSLIKDCLSQKELQYLQNLLTGFQRILAGIFFITAAVFIMCFIIKH